MNIIEAIEETLDEYLQHCDTPAEINMGGCWMFAEDVLKLFPSARMESEPNVHAWLVYQGHCYDAETPNGVNDPRDLLFYRLRVSPVLWEDER